MGSCAVLGEGHEDQQPDIQRQIRDRGHQTRFQKRLQNASMPGHLPRILRMEEGHAQDQSALPLYVSRGALDDVRRIVGDLERE